MSHLRFADDVIFIASDYEELQIMISQLKAASNKVGLKISMQKSRVMTNKQKKINIKVSDLGIGTKKFGTLQNYLNLYSPF